jgi:hypothetical protein
VRHGPIHRDALETDVAKVLVPELRPCGSVVMDQLASHKRPRGREMIAAAGAELRDLPPGPPGCNPLASAGAKLAAPLRKAAGRSISGRWDAIGRLREGVTPQEAANCSRATGHNAT